MILGVSNNFYKDSYNANNTTNSKEAVEKFMTNSSYELGTLNAIGMKLLKTPDKHILNH